MHFASPWFLILLAPWLALVLLLLWGRRRRVDIPFLNLWRGPVQSPAPRRSFERPPVWLAAAIGAMLLAILAAAGPVVSAGADAGPLVTIIADRGLTMAGGRYESLMDEVPGPIIEHFGDGPTEVLAVPGEMHRTSREKWPAVARLLPPTAADTGEALHVAIHDRLAATRGPVIVLTDQAVAIDNPRIMRIGPRESPRNVAIEMLAVRESPAPQAMLRVRNQSSSDRTTVRISIDQRPVKDVEIELPPAGGSRAHFIDLPAVGDSVTARLLQADDIPADDQYSLVRQRLWPAIEPRASLPAELQRMIASYTRLRPPGQASVHVVVMSAADAMPLNEPAIAIAVGATATGELVAASQLVVADHPITRAVEMWPAQGTAAEPPGEGWTPLVRRDGRTIVAVRETPARQVWANLPTAAWAAHPSFVIFWTNAFDYVGAGGEAFGSRPVGRLDGAWTPLDAVSRPLGVAAGMWPGLYRRDDGAQAAVNAPPAVASPSLPVADWRAALRGMTVEKGDDRRGLAPAAVIAAMVLLIVAAVAWKPTR